jgi:hypothetical protein
MNLFDKYDVGHTVGYVPPRIRDPFLRNEDISHEKEMKNTVSLGGTDSDVLIENPELMLDTFPQNLHVSR